MACTAYGTKYSSLSLSLQIMDRALESVHGFCSIALWMEMCVV